jgi:hypothetical protein
VAAAEGYTGSQPRRCRFELEAGVMVLFAAVAMFWQAIDVGKLFNGWL